MAINEYYDIESQDIGKARVRLLKTSIETYSIHGETKWDLYPYWASEDAWVVVIQATGKKDWGPFKQRKNALREHKGTSEVSVLESTTSFCENSAEEKALNKALKLERMGYTVEIEFGEEKRARTPGIRHTWKTNPPPMFIQKRVSKIKLEDLYITQGEQNDRI